MPIQKTSTVAIRLCLLLILTLALLLPSSAQSPTGALVGTVQDGGGGRVPSAAIAVQAVGYSFERKVTANHQGEFRLDDLLPGTYRVLVNARGFAEARSEVTVVISAARGITVTMKPAPVQQTVNVQAQASSITTQPIDVTSAVQQGAVT